MHQLSPPHAAPGRRRHHFTRLWTAAPRASRAAELHTARVRTFHASYGAERPSQSLSSRHDRAIHTTPEPVNTRLSFSTVPPTVSDDQSTLAHDSALPRAPPLTSLRSSVPPRVPSSARCTFRCLHSGSFRKHPSPRLLSRPAAAPVARQTRPQLTRPVRRWPGPSCAGSGFSSGPAGPAPTAPASGASRAAWSGRPSSPDAGWPRSAHWPPGQRRGRVSSQPRGEYGRVRNYTASEGASLFHSQGRQRHVCFTTRRKTGRDRLQR